MIDDVIRWFNGQSETARVLGVTPQAVCAWVDKGGVPPLRAIQVERLTGGMFKAVDLVGSGVDSVERVVNEVVNGHEHE